AKTVAFAPGADCEEFSKRVTHRIKTVGPSPPARKRQIQFYNLLPRVLVWAKRRVAELLEKLIGKSFAQNSTFLEDTNYFGVLEGTVLERVNAREEMT
ncbi:MAG: hypothetical protein ORN83_01095, partial [Chthoniobacteraceae bacterium]|nr:hypothetical protein [Chthoniobacteraceae bacterium]